MTHKDTPATKLQTWLDVIERGAVTVLYCWLFFRLLDGFGENGEFTNILPLISEGLVVVFMLVRRTSSQVSRNAGDWLLAFAATCAPLLVAPKLGSSLVVPLAGAMVWLVGMLIQLHAKVVLGRSFGLVPANRGLKISGPYRLVRHPMYLGYLLTHVAFFALNPSTWNFAVYFACYCLQIPRLLAEERLLRKDPEYVSYESAVRYRLLPGVF